MRKFLAALLAVLMMVSVLAVLPVSAATETVDKTTTSDVPKLLVTEVCWNSTCFEWNMWSLNETNGQITYSDVYDYIEVYNAGTTPVNLYNYSLLQSSARKISVAAGETKHRFDYKMPITVNAYQSTGATGPEIQNPGRDDPDATLQPGEIGIIWVWTGSTITASNNWGTSLGVDGVIAGDETNEVVSFPKFREHYLQGTSSTGVDINQNISSDYQTNLNHVKDVKIVAVYGTGLGNGESMWAIADSDYDLGQDTIQSNGKLNAGIVCLFSNGANTPAGTTVQDGNATIHVPATCVPHRYNENNYLNEDWGAPANHPFKDDYTADSAYTPAQDYLEIDFVESYKQMAILNYAQLPTMGSMPSWQWAYVGPTNIGNALTNHLVTDATTITTGANNVTGQGGTLAPTWQVDAIQSLKDAVIKMEEVDDSESGFDYSHFLTAEQNKDFVAGLDGGSGATGGGAQHDKFPTWALILIIVVGVLIVGGGAAVAVIIILKKKGAAADDVVIEGDVLEAEAPATEDAPVEEAPVEEEKKDE